MLYTGGMAEKIQKEITNPGEFTKYVFNCAREWIPGSIDDINRNRHMNKCNGVVELTKENQDLVDAAITAFINHIGASFCMDYGLYTDDLRYDRKPLGSYGLFEDTWIRENSIDFDVEEFKLELAKAAFENDIRGE